MTIQFDVKPADPKSGMHKINIYLGNCCYTVYGTPEQVSLMKDQGLVSQVRGMRHDENEKPVYFDYPEGVDGAGVKYTSKVYDMREHKEGRPSTEF